jgi:DNA-binding transcriptional MerR regulator
MTAGRARLQKSDTAYRSIGEAADELGLEAHVIRYWETRFPRDIKPVKRADGRRLFRPEDMDALRAVQRLVHKEGLTLKLAKLLLSEQGVEAVLGDDFVMPVAHAGATARELQSRLYNTFETASEKTESLAMTLTDASAARLKALLNELLDIKGRIDARIEHA